jgi:Na+/proline symporter
MSALVVLAAVALVALSLGMRARRGHDMNLDAKAHRLVSQPHFLARKYDSPALGVLVAAVGVIALIPCLVLQLKGRGIIVSTASYGAVSSATAVWLGAAVVTAYVIVSGVRGWPHTY